MAMRFGVIRGNRVELEGDADRALTLGERHALRRSL